MVSRFQEALPHLRKGGHVLLISSVGAFLPFTMLGFYSISKTAMLALTKLMAKVCCSACMTIRGALLMVVGRGGKQELAGDGIRVNCIAPGVIKVRRCAVVCAVCAMPVTGGVGQTRFSTPMWETEESEALSAERSFLGRVGTPDECAGMVRAPRMAHGVPTQSDSPILALRLCALSTVASRRRRHFCPPRTLPTLPARRS